MPSVFDDLPPSVMMVVCMDCGITIEGVEVIAGEWWPAFHWLDTDGRPRPLCDGTTRAGTVTS